MSTIALATSSTFPTPTFTPTSDNMGGGSPGSLSKVTEIVIVTATIVLLLLVTLTVVARTYCLRRYHRQMVAEAIANGTHPLARPDPGDRPSMFEVYVGEDLLADESHISEKRKEREKLGEDAPEAWDEIMVRMRLLGCAFWSYAVLTSALARAPYSLRSTLARVARLL